MEGRASASFICRVTWGNIDLVHSVAIALGFAENCRPLSVQVNPRDRERIVLGVTSIAKSDRIAHLDPRRQADVLIGLAGGGNKPTAAFGQHPRGARRDSLDIASRGSAETTDDDRNGRCPSAPPVHVVFW